MDLYSLTLLLALVSAVGAALAAAAARIGRRRSPARTVAGLRRLARQGAIAGASLAAFSFVFHLATGHRPGTPQSMTAPQLLAEHPAPLVSAGLSALVLWSLRKKAPE